jgi:hypothetical protein
MIEYTKTETIKMTLTDNEAQQLQTAIDLLENPSLAARITSLVGSPIEKGFALLPDGVSQSIAEVSQTALLKASEAAIFTMKDVPKTTSSNHWHKLSAAVSGGVGGFFGIAGIAVELPLSTTIILRSIADIARSHGESISEMETKTACLEVFALGGASKADDATESGYYVVRSLLAKSLAEVTEHMAQKGLSNELSPILIRFISTIAERFGIQVSEKIAAQAVPIIGALGGAVINTVFIDHFQDMARGHFTVRKLELKYGKEQVRALYVEFNGQRLSGEGD